MYFRNKDKLPRDVSEQVDQLRTTKVLFEKFCFDGTIRTKLKQNKVKHGTYKWPAAGIADIILKEAERAKLETLPEVSEIEKRIVESATPMNPLSPSVSTAGPASTSR